MMEDEAFLNCVLKFKPLYDKSYSGNVSAFRKQQKGSCWEYVAESAGLSVEEAKKKYTSLRRKYLHEKKQIESIGGMPNVHRSPLMKYFEIMDGAAERESAPNTPRITVQDATPSTSTTQHFLGGFINSPPSTNQSMKRKKTNYSRSQSECSSESPVEVLNSTRSSEVFKDKYEKFASYLAAELKEINEPHGSILIEDISALVIKYKKKLRSNHF